MKTPENSGGNGFLKECDPQPPNGGFKT